MSKVQEELDRLHNLRMDNILRHNVILKIFFKAELNEKEKKEAGIMRAELAEWLVWHQEP